MPQLDLEKIEEELKNITVFPWDEIVKYSTAVQNDISFISKAPERIEALVKRVKEQTEVLRKIAAIGRYEIGDKVYFTVPGELADEALPKELRLRRGSDEV